MTTTPAIDAAREALAAAGRAEAQRRLGARAPADRRRRHGGRKNPVAPARDVARDAVREVYANPTPRPGPGEDKWLTVERNDARRRYDR